MKEKSTYPVYGANKFVCLFVTNFDPNYQGLANILVAKPQQRLKMNKRESVPI